MPDHIPPPDLIIWKQYSVRRKRKILRPLKSSDFFQCGGSWRSVRCTGVKSPQITSSAASQGQGALKSTLIKFWHSVSSVFFRIKTHGFFSHKASHGNLVIPVPFQIFRSTLIQRICVIGIQQFLSAFTLKPDTMLNVQRVKKNLIREKSRLSPPPESSTPESSGRSTIR